MKKKLIFLIYVLVFLPIVTVFTIFLLIGTGFMGFMPGFEELENPKSNIASQVISEDNSILGGFFIENRTYATFDELSPHLVAALLATEDYRFERHSGIDIVALMRVFSGIITGSSKGGGSTITQQLAKNLFPRDTTVYSTALGRTSHLVISKFKEWVTAVKLEHNYTKKEIMEIYLNTVAFGGNSFGIRAASRTFFNKSPKTLKVEEAAVLVGLLKAPSMYNPVRNTERSRQRRNVVMSQMVKYDFLSQQEYDSLSALPITLDYNLLDHNTGRGTYFREMLRMYLNAENPFEKSYRNAENFRRDSALWSSDPLYGWCNRNFKPDGSKYDLYRDGLKIHTTIDSRLQQYAEEAVYTHMSHDLQPAFYREKRGSSTAPYSTELTPDEVKHILNLSIRRSERYRVLNNAGMKWDEIKQNFMTKTEMRVFSYQGDIDTVMSPLDSIKYYKHFLHCGFMAMDHHTGGIKAYVGGINYKHFKYDAVKVGKRQVGSTFKPFLYTLAMQEGYTPCYEVPNVPVTFLLPTGDTWTPQSSGSTKYDRKMVTLKWGLANSENNISAWLMQQFKPKAVIDIVRLMGVESDIPEVPSICLGSADLTLYEMVGAYSTFANKGMHVEPMFVTRIEDKHGNVLATFGARKNEVISKEAAYLMIDLLKSVVNQGTSVRLRLKYELYSEIAAKTGTTNNHSDGWFMAMIPKLTCGIWVGGEERSIHFDNISSGQGANMALPVFALFIKKVYDDPNLDIKSTDVFDRPETINYNLDCETSDYDSSDDVNESEFFN